MAHSLGQTSLVVALALAAGLDTAMALDIHGHRGARGLLPENTLPAFERAIELGVDVLELDTGLTRDGVVVVLHDRTLSPDLVRRDGHWIEQRVPVRSLTLEQIRAYDVGRYRPGSRADRRFGDQTSVDGTPIPTLADVLDLAARLGPASLQFNIETKLSPAAPGETADPETFARAVIEVVRAAGVEERTLLQSFDWRTLAIARAEAPAIRTSHLTAERDWLNNVERGRPGASAWLGGIDVDDFGGSIPKAVKAAGGAVWSPFWRDLSASAPEEAQALGLEVHVWTVNDPQDMRALKEMGVDGIITDYPDRALEALRP
jgi:glycerophosphoryl diester phosphodiesterase